MVALKGVNEDEIEPMLNDPEPPDKRRHPLEEGPPPPRPPEQEPSEPQTTLRMPLSPPRATYVLLAINLLVFVVGLILPDIGERMFTLGASRAYEVLVAGQYYRLVTAMFNLLNNVFSPTSSSAPL